MAVNFPASLIPSIGSGMEDDLGVEVERTADGSLVSRDLYTAESNTFTLQWRGLTGDERDTLRAFLRTYRNVDITLAIDGDSYTGRPASTLRTTWAHGGRIADCSLQFWGARDAA